MGVAGHEPAKPLAAADLLALAAQHGAAGVQFGDNLPLHRLPDSELGQLAAEARQQNLRLETGTRRLTADNLRRYLSIAQRLGSPFLRVVIDDADYHPDETQVIAVIQSVLGDFRAAGAVLAIENHDRFPVGSLRRIIEATDPAWVGICLDTANSLGAGEGIREVVTGLAPYTVNLHVKDFTINRVSHKMGFVVAGCPAGQGLLNVPWVLEQLRPFGRCVSATLEVWSNPEETMEDTIEKEWQWAEESLRYLRTLDAFPVQNWF